MTNLRYEEQKREHEQNNELEKKVYSQWAFTSREKEKSRINFEIYQKLEDKAKQFYGIDYPTEEDLKNYMCYQLANHRYGSNVYRIYSNPDKLTHDELALICDGGNLCFGYEKEGDIITIYTD